MTDDERFAEIAAAIDTAITAAADTSPLSPDACLLAGELQSRIEVFVRRVDSRNSHMGKLYERFKESRQPGRIKPEYLPKHS